MLLYKLLRKARSLEDLCNSGFNTGSYVSVQLCLPGTALDGPHTLQNDETHQNSALLK